ncbi:carboxypeptidase-like regulatory domain-containing protein [Geofilum rubicundum]|uniref:TonB-dependent receptor n=1 Tax=Geofilum rubicundum JCM 15548 TaxID=1236989 RepID=A0A0E9LZ40_9BACT|nr:carboxypeptidase-like regulatory domain-containing protein [Geofilum rubicundum]GAO30563.1 hypothetical protein JCM15548_12849 [Geofilum rubicundum JCM 15548]
MAQQNQRSSILGRVTDSDGVPLINAHITSHLSGVGAVSRTDGTFEFTYSGEFPLTIAISAIGYHPRELIIENQLAKPLKIQLSEDQRTLQQVEVIGNRITNHHSQRIDPFMYGHCHRQPVPVSRDWFAHKWGYLPATN